MAKAKFRGDRALFSDPAVAEAKAEGFKPSSPQLCPLCSTAFTLESWEGNKKVVLLNGKPVHVHRECPRGV